MKVSFELTMPNNNSWNGKWTGASNKYYVVRTYIGEKAKSMKKMFERESGYASFYYDFGDGWGANVMCEVVTAIDAKKRIKISAGFSGYYWMINEIEIHGRILGRQERKQLEATT